MKQQRAGRRVTAEDAPRGGVTVESRERRLVVMANGDESDSDDLLIMEGASWMKVGAVARSNDHHALAENTRREGPSRRPETDVKPARAGKRPDASERPSVARASAPASSSFPQAARQASANGGAKIPPSVQGKANAEAPDAENAENAENADPDLVVTGQSAFRGALNDFPHARNLCATFPFHLHPPRATCPNCFCFVCESPAPCDSWGAGDDPNVDHCRASDSDPAWVAKRDALRREKERDAARARPAFDINAPPPGADDDADPARGAAAADVKGGDAERVEDLSHIMDGLKDAEATDEADVPPGTLKVALLRHQKRALAWAMRREASPECRGGILADDQGLGKTVSTLAVVVSAPPPAEEARPGRHVLRPRRGDLGRDRGGQRVNRADYERARAPGAAAGERRGSADAAAGSFEAPDVVPHLPACVCADCKRRKKERRASEKLRAQKRNHALAFGDSDDEDAQAAREKHERRAAQRAAATAGPARRLGDAGARAGKGTGGVGPGKVPARTLIVCPAIVVQQWKDEVDEKTDLRAVIYHGNSRKNIDETVMLAHDVVITTYGTVCGEFVRGRDGGEVGKLFNVAWFRVVLDEAHIIRNRRTHGSLATSALQASRRWCLSGTPLMNGADDVYPLFRFLRYQPFASWPHFRETISNPCRRREAIRNVEGVGALRIALRAVTLRRTKATLIDGRPIVDLPPRTVEIREVAFDESERDFYSALENNACTLFNTFVKAGWKANYFHILVLLLKLRQACDHPLMLRETRGAEANGAVPTRDDLVATLGAASVERLEATIRDAGGAPECGVCAEPCDSPVATAPCGHGPTCGECLRAHLRVNAAATGLEHGSCMVCRAPVDEDAGGVVDLRALMPRRDRDRDLGESDSDDDDEDGGVGLDPAEAVARVLARAVRGARRAAARRRAKEEKAEAEAEAEAEVEGKGKGKEPENDEAEEAEVADSAKTSAILAELDAIRAAAAAEGTPPEQTVVFSQFTTFLDIVGPKIEAAGHVALRLDGSQTLATRARVVQEFRRGEASVLLVSLKAASLGLNLNCASRVILVDPWWNAAVEDQAIDRCHRIGQTREVRVIRMIVRDTVELRIQALQEQKRAIAQAALGDGGEFQAAMRQRLTLRDLQDLFGRRRNPGVPEDDDVGVRCRCRPGRCMNCMCVTLDHKCTPVCGCGGLCANGDDQGVAGPFRRQRAEPEPRGG